jgi:tRNA (guanine37-N1)-methyltransferase
VAMRFDVITLFPDMILSAASYGITGRAQEHGIVELSAWNPRDYTSDKHRTVDDRPYGGGPGMVMKYQPLHDALVSAKQAVTELEQASLGKTGLEQASPTIVVYLSPQGKPITQALLAEASQLARLILVAGRYEGVDERFVELDCNEEWSLGDYVISGGELAALVVIDAITRLLPGALGDEDSALQDSHVDGLLDYPHFTRPERIEAADVPDVLLSGNHADIKRWRMKQALGRTWQKRPDLLDKKELTAEQEKLLKEFINQA